MVTLKQVAAHAHVSVQTVSNALNAPHRLRAETLERVTRAIEELNYRPNRNARSLRTSSVELIGYCVPSWPGDQVHLVMDLFLHELCSAAEACGRHMLLFTAPAGVTGMDIYEDLHARRLVDGFVLTQTQTRDPRHDWLTERDIPFASFGRVWGAEAQPRWWVDVDGAAGCAAAVRHMYDTGRRRIGFLGWSGDHSAGLADDRRSGWRSACRDLGLPATSDLEARADDAIEDGARATAGLLDGRDPVDGIVAISDILALGAMREIERRGLVPGADVAVTGFDDSPLASVVSPGLTSLRQPLGEIAAELVRMLCDDAPEPGDRRTGRLLEPQLVVRASTVPG